MSRDLLDRISIEFCVDQNGQWKHWSMLSNPDDVVRSLGDLYDKVKEDYQGKHVVYRIIRLIDQRVIQTK